MAHPSSIRTAPGPLDPARRLALLREIRDGGHILRVGTSAEARLAWAARLVEWRELDRMQDIRVRVFDGKTESGEQVRAAIAVLTLSGVKYLEQHASEPL